MSTPTLSVLLIAVAGVFLLPRRWVPVPFLLLACYIPKAQTLDLGPFSFTVLRTLTIAALVRVLLRRDWKGISPGVADYLMVAWAALMVGTVALHQDPALQVVGRLGLALDGFGLYLVFRLFCRSHRDITTLCLALAVMLVPLALVMAYEKIAAHNLLSVFGGVPGVPLIRDGQIRAQGPFRHAILAGTIGALSVPFMVALWPRYRIAAAIGILASLCIVVASYSSGPLMSLAAALFALSLWPLRRHLSLLRWGAVGLYLLFAAVMNRSPYYLLAEIDLTGGSTGWHRARLIEASMTHLNEWWLAGTDYTRHWMPTGVSFSPDHADLTNHYIALGVFGGLPLLLSFLAVLVIAFHRVGRQSSFLAWTLGSALFAIAITSVSISYFDQSILWLYMTIAFCCTVSGEPAVAVSRTRESIAAIVANHRASRQARVPRAAVDASTLRTHQ